MARHTPRKRHKTIDPSVTDEVIANNMKVMGNRLREMREMRGMSQQEMGDAVDLHYVSVARIEKGQTRTLHMHTLIRMANALQVSTDYLLGLSVINPVARSPRDAQETMLFNAISSLTDRQKTYVGGIIVGLQHENNVAKQRISMNVQEVTRA
jgi:transcriptional regulator with XRE-family HTH domain